MEKTFKQGKIIEFETAKKQIQSKVDEKLQRFLSQKVDKSFVPPSVAGSFEQVEMVLKSHSSELTHLFVKNVFDDVEEDIYALLEQ